MIELTGGFGDDAEESDEYRSLDARSDEVEPVS